MDGNSGISLRWLSALRDHIHSINEKTKKKQQQKPIWLQISTHPRTCIQQQQKKK